MKKTLLYVKSPLLSLFHKFGFFSTKETLLKVTCIEAVDGLSLLQSVGIRKSIPIVLVKKIFLAAKI